MQIFVSDIHKVHDIVYLEGITHVISAVMDWELETVGFAGFNRKVDWRIFEMDDVLEHTDDDAPTKEQVAEILAWAKDLEDPKILVHCFAGVSRSTAIALIIKVQSLGIDKINEAIEWLRAVRPQACPNPVITKFADELLGANGALFDASEKLATEKLLFLRMANTIE